MGTFKKTKLVMLPTNEKAKIGTNVIVKHNTTLAYGKKVQEPYNMVETEQHLYFLSDEEIKKGDWCLDVIAKQVFQVDSKILNSIKSFEKERFKKIIATTDSNLTIKTLLFVQGENKEIDVLLPQPSQSFIEKFVEEYNKGNLITEVMVEYEEIKVLKQTLNEGFGSYYHKAESEFVLKVNPKDNTIAIRKVKDSWNRDEVEEKIRKGAYVLLNGSLGDFDKWIEENL